MISVVVLTYNEEEYILSIIREIENQEFDENYELIVADGGSLDNTVALAESRNVQIVSCKKGKACQMNEAAKIANGDILFFVHADMKLPKNTLSSLYQCIIEDEFDGGGFANIFDRYNSRIKQLGTWLNFRFFDKREQSDRGVFYGDNGIFVKKSVFEAMNGFKEIPIMEDYDFSIRLHSQFKTKKIHTPCIIVSARRHEKAGFLKTRLQWIFIRALFKWGFSPELLSKYYKDVR